LGSVGSFWVIDGMTRRAAIKYANDHFIKINPVPED